MCRFFCLLLIMVGAFPAASQVFYLSELESFTALPAQKLENFLSKKDYKRDHYAGYEGAAYTYTPKKSKEENNIIRNICLVSKSCVNFQTSSINEYALLKAEIKKAGYKYSLDESDENITLFQKNNLTISTSIEIKDSISLFTFSFESKELPKAKDILFAEDMLAINSHEYLSYVFGEANVVKDVFYYSEKETNKCSILFPNTNREVIFIWDDETNYRKTAFLLFGGHLRTNSTKSFSSQIIQNAWKSKQGLYSGMSLQELHNLNGSEISFYAWHLDQAGMLTQKNYGQIDFSKIGLVLNCLNCRGVGPTKTSVVKSSDPDNYDKKIYVSTIIVLPNKEETSTVSR